MGSLLTGGVEVGAVVDSDLHSGSVPVRAPDREHHVPEDSDESQEDSEEVKDELTSRDS